MTSLQEVLAGGIYQAYSYSYPHKTAYRHFSDPLPLQDVWQTEDLNSLFLYLHIPFCEMRCGFCNLFTLVRPESEFTELYLSALEKQMAAVSELLPDAQFARLALGGGTPTYLSAEQMDKLFGHLQKYLHVDFNKTPFGIESSPDTINADKVQLLDQIGARRISIGVQSFVESETRQLVRRQNNEKVHHALTCIKENFRETLNIDLIYGMVGQTIESWLHSLKTALTYKPEELYLYPLYVREKTGLGEVKKKQLIATSQQQVDMLTLYRTGRDYLLDQGYEQVSMRMFRLPKANDKNEPVYSCQDDGMLGLGAGARSYTRNLHYSNEYAVGRQGIKEIIENYLGQSLDTSAEPFKYAHYGVRLSENEQKRRFVIQSLLLVEGLSLQNYFTRFNTDCFDDFPELNQLLELELAAVDSNYLRLTASGLERADSLGPWLASVDIQMKMKKFALR